jgi:hypothetical protein
MQWQLILETTMHAFDINALLTMIAINKLTDQTGVVQSAQCFLRRKYVPI